MDMVKNTRGYIEKLTLQINRSYEAGVMDGCAVLCRRLVETLIIEVYEQKNLSANIKKDGNYVMLDALINVITNESAFSIARNNKAALRDIKDIGDRSAHERRFNATHQNLEELRKIIGHVVSELLQLCEFKP
jgi:hypothetical protein